MQSEIDLAGKTSAPKRQLEELVAVLRNIAKLSGDDEFSFFPFEIQIMDKKSWEVSTVGKASHLRYKKSQLKAARRRVLNEVLPLQ